MLEKDTDVSLQIPSPKEAKQGKYLGMVTRVFFSLPKAGYVNHS